MSESISGHYIFIRQILIMIINNLCLQLGKKTKRSTGNIAHLRTIPSKIDFGQTSLYSTNSVSLVQFSFACYFMYI